VKHVEKALTLDKNSKSIHIECIFFLLSLIRRYALLDQMN
jgi:hypothetical protein